MRRIVALIVAVGVVVVFGGVALAGGSGECSYSSYNQAATDKAEASKAVATKAPDKANVDKLVIAQTNKPSQPTPAEKK